ncbi:MAG: FUSC family protein [Chitinophagaceae bacterium]|nr:FUSC family protein [Chitinophagaceae bacterium]
MIFNKGITSFLSTHYFYEGVRITIGIMVPVLLAAHYNDIGFGLVMALGALCVSIADNAGPIHHRVNGMLATIGFVFIASLATGFALPHSSLLFILLGLFSFTFSIIGIFGNRAASIGTSVLIAISLQLTEPEKGVWINALLTAAGGAWYFMLSMVLYRIRPYKLAQQVLADCAGQTAKFLALKSEFYRKNPDFDKLYESLLKGQVEVHNKQEAVREILFKTRSIVKESTHTGRVLVLAFLEVVDIFEIIMTSEQDYKELHAQISDKQLLEFIGVLASDMANQIQKTSIAIQEGKTAETDPSLTDKVKTLEGIFEASRQNNLNETNSDAYQAINQVISGLKELLHRINNLVVFTSYDKTLKISRPVDYRRFVVPSYINPGLLFSNLNWESNIFRYSIRMMLGVLAAFTISLMFPIGHSYWILLTVVVILKPAYALTRKRNSERLAGTLAGGIIGIIILFFFQDKNLLLLLLILFMILAFSVIRTRYWLGVALLTTYVIISLFLLNTVDYTLAIKDRLLDTFIGSVIAFLVTRLIPPVWEKIKLKDLLANAIKTNKDYFLYIYDILSGKEINLSHYKWHRKETYVALANLSDAFQRMLNEPKKRQEKGEFLHPFIVGCHVLTSRNASLGRTALVYSKTGFEYLFDRISMPILQMLESTEKNIRNGYNLTSKSEIGPFQKTDYSEIEKILSETNLINEQATKTRTIIAQLNGIEDLAYELNNLSEKM